MIILASSSPRRKQLLSQLGLEFEVISPQLHEVIDPLKKPQEIVVELAKEKARSVRKKCSESDIIISADTIVVYKKSILGKPANESEAFDMLSKISGKWHRVYTGVCLLVDNEEISFYEVTKVKFRKMEKAEIEYYVRTKEPLDKAGAYGIQGLGGVFVEKIIGDYTNVVGLPLPKLWKILVDRGLIDLSGFEKGTKRETAKQRQ
ncbi:MAG: Maf family protein [Fervidobacterium sp.]|nr:Maf family protein [Fervidobacterium sp.]